MKKTQMSDITFICRVVVAKGRDGKPLPVAEIRKRIRQEGLRDGERFILDTIRAMRHFGVVQAECRSATVRMTPAIRERLAQGEEAGRRLAERLLGTRLGRDETVRRALNTYIG